MTVVAIGNDFETKDLDVLSSGRNNVIIVNTSSTLPNYVPHLFKIIGSYSGMILRLILAGSLVSFCHPGKKGSYHSGWECQHTFHPKWCLLLSAGGRRMLSGNLD